MSQDPRPTEIHGYVTRGYVGKQGMTPLDWAFASDTDLGRLRDQSPTPEEFLLDREAPQDGPQSTISPAKRSRMALALSRLPEPWRGALVGYHVEGLTQRETAGTMGITQPSLSARLAKARELIRLLMEVPPDDEVRDDLRSHGLDDRQVEIVMYSLRGTMNQVEIGQRVGMAQAQVSHHYRKAQRLLGPEHPVTKYIMAIHPARKLGKVV